MWLWLKKNKRLFGVILIALLNIASTAPSKLFAPASSVVLPVDQAFVLNVLSEKDTLQLNWQIAQGCYLYQNKLHVSIAASDHLTTSLIQASQLPLAQIIEDPGLGSQAIYRASLQIPILLSSFIAENNSKPLALQINYQGCTESGFCYPPVTKWFEIKTNGHTIIQVMPQQHDPDLTANDQNRLEMPKVPDLAETRKEHHLLSAITTFYFLGILLTFTPCVLPMIPILLGVIVGQKHLNTRKAFWISLSYVLSMAFTYAILGMIAATLGKNLQAQLQQPIVIMSFAALFALLALIQMGVVRITLPHSLRIHELLTKLHTQQASGTYMGAAIMGVLATLISSPCVTAPLIGALGYISQSGNLLLGGCALLAMGLGMGTILLVVGTLGGKFLPQSGPWMHTVNHAFAIVMFGLSIWLLSRIFNGPEILVLWGALSLFTAWCMDTFHARSGWSGRIGVLFVLYAVILFWGAWQGQKDPLKPLALNPWNEASHHLIPTTLHFQTVTSIDGLDQLLVQAKTQSRPVLLDFYADWCVTCQHLDHSVFSNEAIKNELSRWILIRADLTIYNQDSKDLLHKFDLIGPPTLLFFDKDGRELTRSRIIGEISPQRFLHQLEEIQQEFPG